MSDTSAEEGGLGLWLLCEGREEEVEESKTSSSGLMAGEEGGEGEGCEGETRDAVVNGERSSRSMIEGGDHVHREEDGVMVIKLRLYSGFHSGSTDGMTGACRCQDMPSRACRRPSVCTREARPTDGRAEAGIEEIGESFSLVVRKA